MPSIHPRAEPTIPADAANDAHDFYRQVLEALSADGLPFLVGGAYAFNLHTGIARETKDLDLFILRHDWERASGVLDRCGWRVDLAYPHWLGKAWQGPSFIDLIFNSGNGATPVDEDWFHHAGRALVFGVPVRVVPVIEAIWSKSFVMERERYDGADVAHLIDAHAESLDWRRLLRRFGVHWRVLLGHLVLFGFIYPARRAAVPRWLMDELSRRLREEHAAPAPAQQEPVCGGTLLSREQYLSDLGERHLADARLQPRGGLSAEEVAQWTQAIGQNG